MLQVEPIVSAADMCLQLLGQLRDCCRRHYEAMRPTCDKGIDTNSANAAYEDFRRIAAGWPNPCATVFSAGDRWGIDAMVLGEALLRLDDGPGPWLLNQYDTIQTKIMEIRVKAMVEQARKKLGLAEEPAEEEPMEEEPMEVKLAQEALADDPNAPSTMRAILIVPEHGSHFRPCSANSWLGRNPEHWENNDTNVTAVTTLPEDN